MAAFIEEANYIVDTLLPAEFGHGESQIFIGTRPEPILQATYTKLYARSDSGTKRVNMMSPTLRRTLKELAQNGPGFEDTVDGVKWKFLSRKFLRPRRAFRLGRRVVYPEYHYVKDWPDKG